MSVFDRLVEFHGKKLHSKNGRRLRMTSAIAAATLNIGVSFAKEAPTPNETQTPTASYINTEAENRVAQITTLRPRAEIFYHISEVSDIESAQLNKSNGHSAYYDDGANAIVINQILIRDKNKQAKDFEQKINLSTRIKFFSITSSISLIVKKSVKMYLFKLYICYQKNANLFSDRKYKYNI